MKTLGFLITFGLACLLKSSEAASIGTPPCPTPNCGKCPDGSQPTVEKDPDTGCFITCVCPRPTPPCAQVQCAMCDDGSSPKIEDDDQGCPTICRCPVRPPPPCPVGPGTAMTPQQRISRANLVVKGKVIGARGAVGKRNGKEWRQKVFTIKLLDVLYSIPGPLLSETFELSEQGYADCADNDFHFSTAVLKSEYQIFTLRVKSFGKYELYDVDGQAAVYGSDLVSEEDVEKWLEGKYENA